MKHLTAKDSGSSTVPEMFQVDTKRGMEARRVKEREGE